MTYDCLSVRLDCENNDRGFLEYSLHLDGEEIGQGMLRRRPSHSAMLPARAASSIAYRIAEPWRGRGYGKQWFRLLLEEAKGIGLTSVIAAVDAHNLVSRRIIEANGGELFDRVEADFTLLMYRVNLSR